MRGLLIEFDVETGKRPQGIDPNDPKLQCYGWQNLEVRPALEIRVIEDDRDIGQYKGREAEGLTVLHDNSEIDTAIEQHIPSRFTVDDETLMKVDLEQRQIKLTDVPGEKRGEVLKNLKARGVKGIREDKPLKMADVYRE